jgi:hypothetical protein
MSALPPEADIRGGTLVTAAKAQEQRSAFRVLSMTKSSWKSSPLCVDAQFLARRVHCGRQGPQHPL